MSKRKDSENGSPDTERKKLCADTSHETSSLDADNMDIPDTLTLARLDRENQGPWEAEYSYGGEADLHQHIDECVKNPGHRNFIPVDKFSIEDLPQGYRDNNIVDYIRAESDLTVRVTVKYVSNRRPTVFPGSDDPYPGYSDRGKRRITVGTGWVHHVDVFNDRKGETCKCRDCQNSSTSETNFAIISINTATHVVFDDLEAEHTTCQLFFDRGGTPDTCSGVVTLTEMSCTWIEIKRDKCEMQYYTHDLDLAHRLDQTLKQRQSLGRKICSKLPMTWNFKRRLDAADQQPLLFIVSHPHGCSKQISLGRWTCVDKDNDIFSLYKYTTATCPGSSGAHVCLPEWLSPGDVLESFTFSGSHRGAQPGNNFCYAATEYHIEEPKPVSLEMLQFDGGSCEDNFSCVEEEDLHKHYETCQKNPGHQNFFPVEKFSMDDLPSYYRKDEIMKLIKLASDLTVRVSAKYVSEERPETVPGTDIPYPWYSDRGGNQMRVGSGWITGVIIFREDDSELPCHCKECQNSLTPKTECACIHIETAAHLVYDRLEGEHTTCHLFFNSGETPGVCKDVVTLNNMWHIESNALDGTCKMTFVTHDLDLADRLNTTIKKRDECLKSLQKPDYLSPMGDGKQNDGQIARGEPPLYIVVSHPHGCAKQVSIGCCGNRSNADAEEYQGPYTSITCPGSSGALGIALGWESFYPCCE